MTAMVLVGAAMTSPAARAHDGLRIEFGRGRTEVVFRGHSRHCAWIPARWETRVERVLLRPGHWREERVPAVTRRVLDLREWRIVEIVVTPATVRRVYVPPEWGESRTRVLVPGRWACVGHGDC
ncbi:MAG: hypothetical protein HUU06_06730 [Planctomycetaceae bacterium]|nr:hypothetical protein [Planctomycetota bacterium]NUN52466.1 hypothetical protein [Planctomycetaceae bacterium]